MASFTPWILLSFTIVLCVTGQGSRNNLCSCRSKSGFKEWPKPLPKNIVKRCFIQKESRDCYHAIVVETRNGRELCFNHTLPWINDFINSTSCEPLLVPLSGF